MLGSGSQTQECPLPTKYRLLSSSPPEATHGDTLLQDNISVCSINLEGDTLAQIPYLQNLNLAQEDSHRQLVTNAKTNSGLGQRMMIPSNYFFLPHSFGSSRHGPTTHTHTHTHVLLTGWTWDLRRMEGGKTMTALFSELDWPDPGGWEARQGGTELS